MPYVHLWQGSNELSHYPQVWETLEKNVFPFVRRFDFFTGEPLILDSTFEFFQRRIRGGGEFALRVTTNGQWEPSARIEILLSSKQLESLIFSVDSFDSLQYAQIRSGGTLSRVLGNIEWVQKKFPHLKNKVYLNFLVMHDNWQHLPQAFWFCQKNNLKLSLGILTRPKEFSLAELSIQERLEILKQCQQWVRQDKIPLERLFYSVLRSLPIGEQKKILFQLA